MSTRVASTHSGRTRPAPIGVSASWDKDAGCVGAFINAYVNEFRALAHTGKHAVPQGKRAGRLRLVRGARGRPVAGPVMLKSRQLGCATIVTRRFSAADGSDVFISAVEPLPTALMRSPARPCWPVR